MLSYFYVHMTPRSVWACSTAFTACGDTGRDQVWEAPRKGRSGLEDNNEKPSVFLVLYMATTTRKFVKLPEPVSGQSSC